MSRVAPLLASLRTLPSRLRGYRHRRYLRILQAKGLQIGRDCWIEQGVTIDTTWCYLISIGDRCTICAGVHILAHDASMLRFLGVGRIGRVDIRDNCFIGVRSVILPGVTIGPNAIVGAGSVVIRDVHPDSVYFGNPARKINDISEYLTAHRASMRDAPIFPTDIYDQEWVPPGKVSEMKERLDRVGYTCRPTQP
jgi:maltose O-acetyltransferase